MSNIPLTKLQKEIMEEFYSTNCTRVIFDKKQRNELWKKTIALSLDLDFEELNKLCPALCHQIKKVIKTKRIFNLLFLASAFMLKLLQICLT